MTEVIGTGLFALAAALLAVAYQYWQFRKQNEEAHVRAISENKKRVIEALISNRFLLTSGADQGTHSTTNFNLALSAVPVYFSHCKACMDGYRTLGDNFTSEKFYSFIMVLMEDVPMETKHIDLHLLEHVPHIRPSTVHPA